MALDDPYHLLHQRQPQHDLASEAGRRERSPRGLGNVVPLIRRRAHLLAASFSVIFLTVGWPHAVSARLDVIVKTGDTVPGPGGGVETVSRVNEFTSMNDSGAVAFVADLDAGGKGLFVASLGDLPAGSLDDPPPVAFRPVAREGTTFAGTRILALQDFFFPRLITRGDVALIASIEENGFTSRAVLYDDGAVQSVRLRPTDRAAGSGVPNVGSPQRVWLNDVGDLAVLTERTPHRPGDNAGTWYVFGGLYTWRAGTWHAVIESGVATSNEPEVPCGVLVMSDFGGQILNNDGAVIFGGLFGRARDEGEGYMRCGVEKERVRRRDAEGSPGTIIVESGQPVPGVAEQTFGDHMIGSTEISLSATGSGSFTWTGVEIVPGLPTGLHTGFFSFTNGAVPPSVLVYDGQVPIGFPESPARANNRMFQANAASDVLACATVQDASTLVLWKGTNTRRPLIVAQDGDQVSLVPRIRITEPCAGSVRGPGFVVGSSAQVAFAATAEQDGRRFNAVWLRDMRGPAPSSPIAIVKAGDRTAAGVIRNAWPIAVTADGRVGIGAQLEGGGDAVLLYAHSALVAGDSQFDGIYPLSPCSCPLPGLCACDGRQGCEPCELPGPAYSRLKLRHPIDPQRKACLEPNSNCRDLLTFHWSAPSPELAVDLVSPAKLGFRLRDATHAVVAEASAATPGEPQRLVAKGLPAGAYSLEVSGSPAPYELRFGPEKEMAPAKPPGQSFALAWIAVIVGALLLGYRIGRRARLS